MRIHNIVMNEKEIHATFVQVHNFPINFHFKYEIKLRFIIFWLKICNSSLKLEGYFDGICNEFPVSEFIFYLFFFSDFLSVPEECFLGVRN